LVDEGLEDGLFVVADDEDFLDLGDLGYGAEAMLDDGVAGDGKEGLKQGEKRFNDTIVV
jgi:hypothetical protein